MLLKYKKAKAKKENIQTSKKIAVGATVGILAGVASGILLAPKTGKETREELKKSANNLSDTVKEKSCEAKEKLSNYINERKNTENNTTTINTED